MTMRIDSRQPDFAEQFVALLHLRDAEEESVSPVVSNIVSDVKQRGDAAVIDYSQRFDQLELTSSTLRIEADALHQARQDVAPDVQQALELAAQRVLAHHQKQLPQDCLYEDEAGVQLGWRWTPVDAVGLYVPGGRASYPSSVLHNAIAAKVAGVQRLAMVVPSPGGVLNPAVLVAAQIAGVDEIYRIGGAQAVAALAYGTETIAPVDVIVGPGNAYVAEAKRQVFGRVGIDMIAGPSEILVVADAKNDPSWIAADLLSQAEHDPMAQSILITDDADFADAVAQAVETTLQSLDREAIARASWQDYGAIITVTEWNQAIPLINRIAPEHLELAVDDPQALAQQIPHAGAIFMGRHTPEAIGDYVAGPSHVLPTSHTARFASGLSVFDFIKKTSIIGCTVDSLRQIGDAAATLADAEGLGAHALSVRCRL